jgi:3-oxoacyl-[acyl-carrier-protein] synthase III
MNAKILGTGSYLPEKVVTNHDLARVVDTSDEWIYERTGIKERRQANATETVAYMGHQAALAALSHAKMTPQDLDMIIVSTTTPTHNFPSTACQIQAKLQVRHVPAFDITAACAGFIYTLSIAHQYIKAGAAKNVLLVGVESMFRLCNPDDRSTLVLFGDGAGAVIVSASEEPGILSSDIYADGKDGHLLQCHVVNREHETPQRHGTIQMQGNDVFKIAVRELSNLVKASLEKNNIEPADIDWLIPHQANLRIIRAVAKKLNMSLDKVILTLDKHGNTSSASIPIALDEAVKSNRIQPGQTLLLEAFGGGFVWGSVLIKY